MKFTKIFLLSSSILLLSGCSFLQPEIKTVYIKSDCAEFKEKLKFKVTRINDVNATISWEDVDKIEHFLEKKKVFNKEIKKLNKKG